MYPMKVFGVRSLSTAHCRNTQFSSKLSELSPLPSSLPLVLMTWRYVIGKEPKQLKISLL